MNVKKVLKKLKSKGSKKNIESMKRFGINVEKAFGVSMPNIRALGKELGKDHELAQKLWNSGFHEARILASIVDLPEKVSSKQMDSWIKDFNSWDLCDQVCANLFALTPFCWEKAKEWTSKKNEWEKRAGFSLMACIAWKYKQNLDKDKEFEKFFPFLIEHAWDERIYVKKAINWALRQIGKRNKKLNKKAIICANKILKQNTKSARWIANDALHELQSKAVQKRLNFTKSK